MGMATGGVLIAMYVTKVVSSLKENLNDIKYFSFFYYYDTNKALLEQEISAPTLIVFVLTIVICTVTASIVFTKKDISA